MGSVSSIEQCPRCRQESYHSEFKYKSNETYEFCELCGRYESFFWKRNEEGQLLTKDETSNYAYDNLIEVHEICRAPFGVYHLGRDKGGSFGVLETCEDYRSFRNKADEIKADENLTTAYITFLDAGEIIREIIKGEVSLLPDEWKFQEAAEIAACNLIVDEEIAF